MKKMIVIIAVLMFVGCKGKQGEPGVQGIRGSGSYEMLMGAVNGDDFVVADSKIKQAAVSTVYINSTGEMTSLPYYLNGPDVNVYYTLNTNDGTVRIYNANLAGATKYYISLVLK